MKREELKNKQFGMFVLSASTIDIVMKLEGSFPIEGGVTRNVSKPEMEPGGEANLIILFNRLGGNAYPVGPVGTDIYTKFLLDTYKQIGVETKGLKPVEGYNLPISNAIVDENGEHTFVTYMPGCSFDSEESIFQKLQECSCYYLNGYHLAEGHSFRDLALKLMYKANEYDIPVFFDPGPCLVNATDAFLQHIYDHVDIISLNEKESYNLTGLNDPEKAAKYISDKTDAYVIVKVGPKGCYTLSKKIPGMWYNSFTVKMIDTMGCGDSFISAFMYGYIMNFDLDTCLILANAAGAVKAGKFGTGRNVATFDEMVDILESNGIKVNDESKTAGKFINLRLRRN